MHFILLLASIFLGSYPNVSFALDSAMGAIKALTGEDLNQLTGLDTYNLNMGGWLTPGFTFNPSNPSDRSNGPVQFNNRANELQLYQLGLFVEKPLRREMQFWQVGGRFEFMFGTDTPNYC